ncbi:MAG: hypothetical protein P8M34_03060, partial [Saprospiraceae bacterium]|nr:hypothetical protein [Saprospiraceae bacterium]
IDFEYSTQFSFPVQTFSIVVNSLESEPLIVSGNKTQFSLHFYVISNNLFITTCLNLDIKIPLKIWS